MLTLNKRHAFPKKMYLSCGLSFRLRSRLNLSPVSNKRCKAVPISLFWAKNELNASTLVRF